MSLSFVTRLPLDMLSDNMKLAKYAEFAYKSSVISFNLAALNVFIS
jgi:hypothetical protein